MKRKKKDNILIIYVWSRLTQMQTIDDQIFSIYVFYYMFSIRSPPVDVYNIYIYIYIILMYKYAYTTPIIRIIIVQTLCNPCTSKLTFDRTADTKPKKHQTTTDSFSRHLFTFPPSTFRSFTFEQSSITSLPLVSCISALSNCTASYLTPWTSLQLHSRLSSSSNFLSLS